MRVIKRDGTSDPMRFDEITEHIASLSEDLDPKVIDPVKITMELVDKIQDGIHTNRIDTFTAEICHSKNVEHPHFNILASRLIIGNHQKKVKINNLLSEMRKKNLIRNEGSDSKPQWKLDNEEEKKK